MRTMHGLLYKLNSSHFVILLSFHSHLYSLSPSTKAFFISFYPCDEFTFSQAASSLLSNPSLPLQESEVPLIMTGVL
jgi:hypothetical protein